MRSIRHPLFNFFRPWLLSTLWLCATAAQAQTTSPITLYHRFEVGIETQWQSIKLPLRSDEWRLGGPEGPVANPEQLRSVLESLDSLVIGCRCAGTNAGTVHYPVFLELAHPQIDRRQAAARDFGDRWWSTSGETLLTFATGVIVATSVSESERQQSKSATDSGALAMEAGFLGLVAPQSFIAGIDAAGGQSLSFDIRVRSGPLRAAKIEPLSGSVILSTQRMRAEPAQRRSGRRSDAT